MSLSYAVDRLYQSGWTPGFDSDCETLPDGRRFPSLEAVQREFAQAGLELAIKHNPTFQCYRASWERGEGAAEGAEDGTVIGSCEHEAAVYALAQLRAALAQRQLAGV